MFADTSNVNDTDSMERILQMADEVELFQKRVMALEEKVSQGQVKVKSKLNTDKYLPRTE